MLVGCIVALLVWSETKAYLWGEASYEFRVDKGVAHELQLNFDATVATPCHCALRTACCLAPPEWDALTPSLS